MKIINSELNTLEIATASTDDSPSWPEAFSSLVRLDVAGQTHVGKVRESNEDNFLVVRAGRSLQTLMTSLANKPPEQFDEVGYAMVVADGVGGASAGEIASSSALATLVNLVLQTPDWILRADEHTASEIMKRLQDRFLEVNRVIIAKARKSPRLSGMGTTLTVAWSLFDLFNSSLPVRMSISPILVLAITKSARNSVRTGWEVYLAEDTKLDRKVALKILPADVAANQDRVRRFVQEAKAAAALNHPHIAHIYEISEADGVHFIAMEYIDGDTLRQCIHPGAHRAVAASASVATRGRRSGQSARRRNPASRSGTRQHHDQSRWPREGSRFRSGKTH